MSKKIKVGVVIPHHKGRELLYELLEALHQQKYQNYELIIVDNGSSDGSSELLASKFPEVTVLRQAQNLGFAGGVNRGIEYCFKKNFTYVVLLNNDAKPDRNWLNNLVQSADSNKNAAIITSKIISSNSNYLDSTGEFMTISGLAYPRGRGEENLAKYDQQVSIIGASGGASLYRLEYLKLSGLFDERFFAYYEDIDISLRLKNLGYQVLFQPKAIVYHKIGYSSSQINGFTTLQYFKNLPHIIIKNFTLINLLKILPLFMIIYTLIFLKSLLHRNRKEAIKGIVIGLKMLPKSIQLHNQQIKNITVNSKEQYSWLTKKLLP